MSPDQDITLLSPANIVEFAPLYRTVFNLPPWNDGWSEEAVTERLTSFAKSPTFRGMGVLTAGEPIGLVLGWGERWVQGWVFHIKEMCIHERYQREGYGAKLMQCFEDHTRRISTSSKIL